MKPIKWAVLYLVAAFVTFYYQTSVIQLFLDSENQKLGDILAAYVPLVFALTWIVYGGYRFFIAEKATGE